MGAARGSRPTLEAVAAHAEVSRATVSRVVNGVPGVREEVRATVLRSVDALGYVPNGAARALVTRRTGAVAVVIAEPQGRVFDDPFFAQQLRGISRELGEHGLQLLLTMLERPQDAARFSRYLAGGHVDGTLMFSLHGDAPPPGFTAGSAARDAGMFGLPTVFGGRPGWAGAREDPGLLYVDTDNHGGGRQAVTHLLERGRRRIAVITGPLDQTSAADRLRGARDALRAATWGPAGDPSLLATADFTVEGGEKAMTELLERRADLDGVFAGNDLMAVGALRALRAHGRSVPRDVAVVGYDDAEPAAWADPALTTVRQEVEEMGAVMARLLVRRLGHAPDAGEERAEGPPGPVVTPARLVVRASS